MRGDSEPATITRAATGPEPIDGDLLIHPDTSMSDVVRPVTDPDSRPRTGPELVPAPVVVTDELLAAGTAETAAGTAETAETAVGTAETAVGTAEIAATSTAGAVNTDAAATVETDAATAPHAAANVVPVKRRRARPRRLRVPRPQITVPPPVRAALARVGEVASGSFRLGTEVDPAPPVRRLVVLCTWAALILLIGLAVAGRTALAVLFTPNLPTWYEPALLGTGVGGIAGTILALASVRDRVLPWLFLTLASGALGLSLILTGQAL